MQVARWSVACVIGLASAGAAPLWASPPAPVSCGGARTRDCFRGEVLVLDGGPAEDDTDFGPCTRNADCRDPALNPAAAPNRVCVDPTHHSAAGGIASIECPTGAACRCLAEVAWCTSPLAGAPYGCRTWRIENGGAVGKLLRLVEASGAVPPATDQFVVWAADFDTDRAPAFERFLGKNDVAGIGLPVADPAPQYRFKGWVTAGSVSQNDHDAGPRSVLGCPAPPPHPISRALGRAAAALYTPYLRTGAPPAWDPPGGWSPLLGLDGQLCGSSAWFTFGDGTYQTGAPVLRLSSLDLYLMGLMPAGEVPPLLFIDQAASTPLPPVVANLCSPAVRVRGPVVTLDLPAALARAGVGPRQPAFAEAPHHIRQQWVAVTLPGHDPPDGILDIVERRRRDFSEAFYALTRARGRIVSTFDGTVDDFPAWEFEQADDDRRAFTAQGDLRVLGVKDGVAVVDAAGPDARMRFAGFPVPIRIDPRFHDALLVRMRVPHGSLPSGAHALASFPGGPTDVRLPATTGAALVADGRWHVYGAYLAAEPGWADVASYASFDLAPSDTAGAGIEIDSVRLVHVGDPAGAAGDFPPPPPDAGPPGGPGEAAAGPGCLCAVRAGGTSTGAWGASLVAFACGLARRLRRRRLRPAWPCSGHARRQRLDPCGRMTQPDGPLPAGRADGRDLKCALPMPAQWRPRGSVGRRS